MSLKTILVHLDDSVHRQARLEAAARLAQSFAARLIGMYLVPVAELSPSIAALLPSGVMEERLRATGEAQDSAERAFRSAAATASLQSVEWIAPAGDPFDAAIAQAHCADLVVVGQRNPDDKLSGFTEAIAIRTLLGSGRPVLFVPYIGLPASLGERVLVAFDGGREAARAVGDAMPLLERATHVSLMLGGRDGGQGDVDASGARLTAWLRDHGIAAVIESDHAPRERAGEWALSRAADLACDLIVMGGYGHSRAQELVLGGMTRTMIQAMPVAVLMSH
jgi:nucleotide-binding universal stress UspA family protein